MRWLGAILAVILIPAASAFASVRAEVVEHGKLKLTFNPAPAAGVVAIRSNLTVPIELHADGRAQYTLPLALLPQTAATLTEVEINAGDQKTKLDLRGADLRSSARVSYSERAYEPVIGQHFTDETRRRYAMLAGVLLSCAFIACGLLPRKTSFVVLGLIAVGASAGVVFWSQKQDFYDERHAIVEQVGSEKSSTDAWTWLLCRDEATIEWPTPDGPTPRIVAASRNHLTQLAPVLVCNANGNVERIRLALRHDGQVAIWMPGVNAVSRTDPLDLSGVVATFYRRQRVLGRDAGHWRVAAVPAP